jgi:hypothetical protein
VPLYVPSFGKSPAIAAAPKAMAVLSVTADTIIDERNISVSLHYIYIAALLPVAEC